MVSPWRSENALGQAAQETGQLALPLLLLSRYSCLFLQALAEDEAALTASGPLTEVSGLTRQDSARDLGDTLRSPSPHSRRAASPRNALTF